MNNNIATGASAHQRLVTRSLNQLMGIVNGVLCDEPDVGRNTSMQTVQLPQPWF